MASFVCKVEKTKCPVNAARIAISVVSTSRISPTITTFGSPRKILLNPAAKVRLISGFTAICTTPGILFSTGSSIVTIRRSFVFRDAKKVYSVVDFPDPVGPVIKTIPFGRASRFLTLASCNGLKPICAKSNLCCPNNRKLIDSPVTEGIVAIRTSIGRPSNSRLIRPSCGNLLSAISRCAMILIREMSEA